MTSMIVKPLRRDMRLRGAVERRAQDQRTSRRVAERHDVEGRVWSVDTHDPTSLTPIAEVTVEIGARPESDRIEERVRGTKFALGISCACDRARGFRGEGYDRHAGAREDRQSDHHFEQDGTRTLSALQGAPGR